MAVALERTKEQTGGARACPLCGSMQTFDFLAAPDRFHLRREKYNVLRCSPSLRWNKDAARDLLRSSRGLFGLSFLNLIFARADICVLAKLYSPSALGLYTMAIYLVQTPHEFHHEYARTNPHARVLTDSRRCAMDESSPHSSDHADRDAWPAGVGLYVLLRSVCAYACL